MNAEETFDQNLLSSFNLAADSIANELQVVNIWLSTLEPVLSKLIRLVEQSVKLLHLQESIELPTHKDTRIFVPLRVPSGHQQVDDSRLERKHMAYLLGQSLFAGQSIDEIDQFLRTVESKCGPCWSPLHRIYRGTLIFGGFLCDIVKHCNRHVIQQQEFYADDPIPIDWQEF